MLNTDLQPELAATDWGAEPKDADRAVGIADVQAAAEVIAEHLDPTPLVRHPLLAEATGCDLWVKLENAQPVGSFKIRGTLNMLAAMTPEQRGRGLVTATRGNFGQSLARAATLYGTRCTIFVPEGNRPDKNRAMEATGARIIVQGHDFDAAWDASVRWARRENAVSVHPARHAAVVAGQGTVALEMLEQVTRPFDVIIVPVGGGSLAAGTAITVKALSPQTRVIAVQAENAPAFHHAWHSGRYEPFRATETIADGLATRIPVRYTLEVMRRLVDDFILVSEREIQDAVRCLLETVHQLAEGGGAAALAGALQLRESLAGQRVGVVLTGGNIDLATLRDIVVNRPSPHQPRAMPMFPMASLDYGDR